VENKKHIIAVTAIIKNSLGDKFLIIKRSKDEIAFPGKWSFPGGKLEKGESIFQALKREVLEEVGLDIEDYKKYLKDFTFIKPDGHNVVGFNFLVRAINENVKLGFGFDEYKWIDPKEFNEFDHIEGMEEEVELAFRN